MAILTDVKNIRVEVEYPSTLSIRCNARLYGQEAQEVAYRLTLGSPFNCCGMRTLSNFRIMEACPEFQTKETLKKIISVLNRHFNGKNVSFILNASQRAQLEVMLKNMSGIGRGLVETPFHNFNMRNTNYLYVWTYGGRSKKK